MNEAYATLSNAYKELYCVLAPILRADSLNTVIFDAFYNEALAQNFDLLDFAFEDENRHWALKELIRNEKELEMVCAGQMGATELPSSDDESKQESLQKMSVEDLVSFINDGQCRKKNKKRLRRKRNCKEIEDDNDDVERFRRKLDQEFVGENRLKPCISQRYVDSLRTKILQLGN